MSFPHTPTHIMLTLTPLTGCGELTLANGDVSYTNGFLINSTATHTCNPNHRLLPVGGAMWTCTMMSGWSGQDVTCCECDYE